MEIVDPCYCVLSNLEVLTALKSMKDTKKRFGLRNLATITYETLQYLEETPARMQNRADIIQFLQEMKPFKMTKNECLMLVNDPPTEALHIQLLIEDSEERLTEDQVGKVLELVAKYLIKEE